jgi:hypothetical protein
VINDQAEDGGVALEPRARDGSDEGGLADRVLMLKGPAV